MAKNRRKKRRKRPGGQAAAPQPQVQRPSRVAPEARPDVVAARPGGPGTEGTVVGTVVEVERESLWIEVGGERAMLYASELMLGIGERPADRYTVGDGFEASVFQMDPDPESGATQFSIRRASPYPEALAGLEVGAEVQATIVNTYDVGIELDVGGVRGNAYLWELPLQPGESPHQRYKSGETIKSVLVWQVNHETRHLTLSGKRNTPGYMEALQRRTVGEVLSGTIIFVGDGLLLDVDGLVGSVALDELALADGESAQDRYAVGETIDGLFVCQIGYEARDIYFSVKRNGPGYVEALRRRAVGEVVSATVTELASDGGLRLDVDGLVGSVAPDELVLADGEFARERYAVGETIDDLFVWQVDYEDRGIALSVKRNAPGYLEALGAIARGNEVSGAVTSVMPGGLWLDVQGAIGWIFKEEALLEDGEALAERYSVGDPVTAVVWHIDRASRTVLLSARRIGLALVEEPIVHGATIKVMVVRKRDGGVDVSVDGESEIYIPDYALSLRPGGSPDLGRGQEIDVVVMDAEDGVPTVLSHRRALGRWEAARDRFVAGVVVPDARVIPWVDRPNPDDGRAAVDLGPITGFIPLDERDAEAAEDLMSRRANRRHGVVIEALNEDAWTASVSEAKFEARWRELADNLPTGEGIEGEIVDITRGVATLDLGSGLLGEMRASELLPANGDERIGEIVTVGIRSVDREEYRVAVEIQNYELIQMIAADETLVCELKAVFLKAVKPESPRARQNRQDVNRKVVRAMAGMMNREGGHVIVGVEDTDKKDGEVVGWEASGWENQNAMATALSELVGRVLSAAAGGLYEARFERLPDGHEVLDIECRRADEPIFLTYGDTEEFPVRYPAMTKKLQAQEAYQYIRERFSS